MTDDQITISQVALDAMYAEISRNDPTLETGGILVGSLSGHHFRVTNAGGSGPAAVRTQSFFLRDLAFTQRFAAKEQAATGAVWVGEWHTHPLGPPRPSAADLNTYSRLVQDDDLHFLGTILSIIVTPDPPQFRLTAWLCGKRTAHSTPLVRT